MKNNNYIETTDIKNEIFTCVVENIECLIVELKDNEYAFAFKNDGKININLKGTKKNVIEDLIKTINQYKITNENLMKTPMYSNKIEEMNSIIIRYTNYCSQLENLI